MNELGELVFFDRHIENQVEVVDHQTGHHSEGSNRVEVLSMQLGFGSETANDEIAEDEARHCQEEWLVGENAHFESGNDRVNIESVGVECLQTRS